MNGVDQLTRDFGFAVEVKYTRRKGSIGFQIRNGGVRILAPQRTPGASIRRLLGERQQWIRQQLELLQSNPCGPPQRQFCEGEPVLWLGNDYPLSVAESNQDGIDLDCGMLCISLCPRNFELPAGPRNDLCLQMLERWYQQQAERDFHRRLQLRAGTMELKPASLKIRSYRSRWGSCDQFDRITLNTRLIMAPPAIIDYVVIHELSHMVHMNHSAAFWQLVARYCPDYRERRQWLKRQGYQLQAGYSVSSEGLHLPR